MAIKWDDEIKTANSQDRSSRKIRWDDSSGSIPTDQKSGFDPMQLSMSGPSSIGKQITDRPEVQWATKAPGAINRSSILNLAFGDKSVPNPIEAVKNPESVPSIRSRMVPEKVNRLLENPMVRSFGGPPIEAVNSLLSSPDFLVDPVQTGLMAAGAKFGQSRLMSEEIPFRLSKTKFGSFNQLQTKDEILDKARKLTSEILQPPISKTTPYALKGKESPSIEMAMKYMKPSRDYRELMKNYQDISNKRMETKKFLLDVAGEKGEKIGSRYLKPLEEFIAERLDPKSLKAGHISKEDASKLINAMEEEKTFLKNMGGELPPAEADLRKQYLQDLTDTLLTRRDKGTSIDLDPLKNQALDKLRYGLKSEIESVNPMIKRLNDPYGGLKEAAKLSARQFGISRKATPPTMIEKISSPIRALLGRRAELTAAEVAQMALERNKDLMSKTKAVAELVKRARMMS